jgi:hypothetical protein
MDNTHPICPSENDKDSDMGSFETDIKIRSTNTFIARMNVPSTILYLTGKKNLVFIYYLYAQLQHDING